jgi:hypothetical protein
MFELVIYKPTERVPPRLYPDNIDDEAAWLERLRAALSRGATLAIDLSGLPLSGPVPQSRETVNPPAIQGANLDEIGRWPLTQGADLLFLAREIRKLPRRLVRTFSDVIEDEKGPRLAWDARTSDGTLLARLGVVRLSRGSYRLTSEGVSVRALVLGARYELAPKKDVAGACTKRGDPS